MKTKTRQGRRRFQLRIQGYGNSHYLDRAAKLETALAGKPRTLRIDMVGAGEIPADSALLIRSILRGRSPRTRVITRARSSLHGGSVLVWLLGDSRSIREDATLYFRRPDLPDDRVADATKVWKEMEVKYTDSYDEFNPHEGSYARVVELINEFLPTKELAGRIFGVPVLKQFGLVESEEVDCFLTNVFSKRRETKGASLKDPGDKEDPGGAAPPRARRVGRH